MSIFADGSSNIKILLLIKITLARQINCFCPADKFNSKTFVSNFKGYYSKNLSILTSDNEFQISLSGNEFSGSKFSLIDP